MTVYVVTRNRQPCLATLSETEACDLYEKLVHSGCFRQAAVHIVQIAESRKRVLLEAYQADSPCTAQSTCPSR